MKFKINESLESNLIYRFFKDSSWIDEIRDRLQYLNQKDLEIEYNVDPIVKLIIDNAHEYNTEDNDYEGIIRDFINFTDEFMFYINDEDKESFNELINENPFMETFFEIYNREWPDWDKIEESLQDKVQYGVHQFSTESIIFRGTEEECIKYINERPKLWDDAEVYWMTPDDPHYLKEGIYSYQTWIRPVKGEKQPSKTLTYGSDIILTRSPYSKEVFGRDWKRHITKIIEWCIDNNPGLIRLTHDFRSSNFNDPNSDEAFIAAIEDKMNRGEYLLKESLSDSHSGCRFDESINEGEDMKFKSIHEGYYFPASSELITNVLEKLKEAFTDVHDVKSFRMYYKVYDDDTTFTKNTSFRILEEGVVETESVFFYDRYTFKTLDDLASFVAHALEENGVEEDIEKYPPRLKLVARTSKNESVEDNICCICKKPFDGYGNNAEPVCSGSCCDECNMKEVIPARMKMLKGEQRIEDGEDNIEESKSITKGNHVTNKLPHRTVNENTGMNDEDIKRNHGYRQDNLKDGFDIGDRVAHRWADTYNVGTIKDIREHEGIQYQVEWDYSDGDYVEWLYGDEITHWVDVNEGLTEARNPYFTPYGYEDAAKVLNRTAPEYYWHLKEIEMDKGDGIKLANYALKKGMQVMLDKNSDPDYPEFYLKDGSSEYHWGDYFYTYGFTNPDATDLIPYEGNLDILNTEKDDNKMNESINEEMISNYVLIGFNHFSPEDLIVIHGSKADLESINDDRVDYSEIIPMTDKLLWIENNDEYLQVSTTDFDSVDEFRNAVVTEMQKNIDAGNDEFEILGLTSFYIDEDSEGLSAEELADKFMDWIDESFVDNDSNSAIQLVKGNELDDQFISYSSVEEFLESLEDEEDWDDNDDFSQYEESLSNHKEVRIAETLYKGNSLIEDYDDTEIIEDNDSEDDEYWENDIIANDFDDEI